MQPTCRQATTNIVNTRGFIGISKPGDTVAVGAGSRGIANIPDLVKATVDGYHKVGVTDSECLTGDEILKRWPWLKHFFADGAYDRGRLMDKAAFLDFVIEIVRKMEGQEGFEVLPRRWVVERTFGWMMRWRRLVRDYEQRIDVSEAMMQVAMGSLLLRRIAH